MPEEKSSTPYEDERDRLQREIFWLEMGKTFSQAIFWFGLVGWVLSRLLQLLEAAL